MLSDLDKLPAPIFLQVAQGKPVFHLKPFGNDVKGFFVMEMATFTLSPGTSIGRFSRDGPDFSSNVIREIRKSS